MKTWSRKLRMLAAAVALSLPVVAVAPAAPAYALNLVACNEGGYLRIWYWSWTSDGFEYEDSRCWANAGEDDQLYIRRATRLWSGNNAGYVEIDDERRVNFPKDKEVKLDEGAVTFLKIY
ncbi:hypothetical protein [Jidongwangia harbinensis]|uniref:hypothetical protein n=1 Tax=Jidongwangia harbinensis TaxID=2878561 RepID=UPI001CD9CEDB|nr:hypothetical protein [Jidongwangia harbinensis]MCA2215325.1 hypothetical protein [Jidongwangia harbinensis]